MKHPIKITVINDTNGQAQSSDGVMMMFIKGVAVANTLNLDQAYLLTKLADATALGINAAYDVTNGTAVYQQISEFYAESGSGGLLWLVVTAISTNPYATYVAGNTFANLVRFTASADPANRAKMIGLCYEVPQATQSATDFPADVTATILALQTAQQNLFNQGFQFSAIVDGYMMSDTVTPANLGTRATDDAFAVSCCITGTKPNGVSAVGLALGHFSRIGIGHGFGAVEDGPRVTNTAYLTNGATIPASGVLVVGKSYTVLGGNITYNSQVLPPGYTFVAITAHTTFTTTAGGYVVTGATPIKALSPGNATGTGDIDYLGDKQYMFLRTWFNHSGFYWNDGATCESSDKQLSTQEYNRVANALSADALSFFIDEMGKNLPLDKKTGAIDQGYLNAKQAQFYTQFIEQLTVQSGTGDLTDASLTLSGPDFNNTKTMTFKLDIVPTPILGEVDGTVQFTSTL